MNRRLALRLGSVLCCAGAGFDAARAADAAAGPHVLKWRDLMPAGWHPMQAFRNVNLDALDDADPRATALLQSMRAAWNEAPVDPALHGRHVRLAGYVVPLEGERGELSEFLLVPNMGDCIHTPPPPANQIVFVQTKAPVRFRTMDFVWVTGTVAVARAESAMGTSGYRLSAEDVRKYAGAWK